MGRKYPGGEIYSWAGESRRFAGSPGPGNQESTIGTDTHVGQ